MTLRLIFLFILTSSQRVVAQSPHLQLVENNIASSFRGLSIVNDQVAWVSGSNGHVGVSVDGGVTWTFNQVKGFEKADFRTLYAFSATNAIIANAGSPANILLTLDGGKTWSSVYTNDHKDAFLDGVDFWNNKDGVIYGDPIDGRMVLLETHTGGKTWVLFPDLQRPVLKEGEASFAASGTGIRCYGKNKLMLATGGMATRLWSTENNGLAWKTLEPPMVQGRSGTGIFSFSFYNEAKGIIVGGDYMMDSLHVDHNMYTVNGGKTWLVPKKATRGYRECVEYLTQNSVLAVGPSGIDLSEDGGVSWNAFSDEKKFHVIRKARKGSLVIVAGSSGRISVVK